MFNPILQANVKSTDRVGVIGIGGLGHMALGFLAKWGCEVYAFTSSDAKRDEAKQPEQDKAVNQACRFCGPQYSTCRKGVRKRASQADGTCGRSAPRPTRSARSPKASWWGPWSCGATRGRPW